jgi:protein-S-isoprenylcysteine O-methyltransferase Ste14
VTAEQDRTPIAEWVRNARLNSRTGAGMVVAGLGLATAVPPSPGAFAIAAVLALAGALVRFWSAGIISKNQELATSGPYAYVRNPLYFGSLLIAVAFCILNGNPWFVVPAAVGGVVLYIRTVRAEEAVLSERFGEAFARYREQVPAILPWKGRCRVEGGEGGETAYALEQSLHNREYNGALGTLAMLAVFYAYMHWVPPVPFRVGTALLVAAAIVVRAVRVTQRGRRLRAEREAAEAAAGETSEPAQKPAEKAAEASAGADPGPGA